LPYYFLGASWGPPHGFPCRPRKRWDPAHSTARHVPFCGLWWFCYADSRLWGPDRPACPACHALRLLSPNVPLMGKDQFSLLPWLWAPGCYYTLHYPRGVLGRPRNRRLTGGRCRQVGPGSRVGRASLLLFAHIATSPGGKNRQICWHRHPSCHGHPNLGAHGPGDGEWGARDQGAREWAERIQPCAAAGAYGVEIPPPPSSLCSYVLKLGFGVRGSH